MNKPVKHKSRVWFNLTSSANWNRPPVGIIRVERSIYAELSAMMGPENCIPCIWQGDRFVKMGTEETHSDEARAVMERIFPSSNAFDVSYKYAYGLVAALLNRKGGDVSEALDAVASADDVSPAPGDILITMGLDWDQGYKEQLYDLSTRGGLKIIAFCYDLIPALYPQYCVGDVSAYFKEYFYNVAWGADAVVCISECTRKDFEQFVTDHNIPSVATEVIELGDSIPVAEGEISDVVSALMEEDYIVFVSTIERRKNHEVLYRAYHLLAKQGYDMPKMIFVGMRGWGVDELMQDIKLDPLVAGKIMTLTELSDAELRLVIEKSLFCVYPSLYEGWGLPVAEALTLGKYLLVSDRASLPEVGGDLVTYIDPWSPNDWAREMLNLFENRRLIHEREADIRKRYKPRQWKTAAKTIRSLAESLAEAPATKRSFNPVWDFSSHVGIRDKEVLHSGKDGGYLFFGNNFALNAGTYEVTVEALANADGINNAVFDVTIDRGSKKIAEFPFEPTDTFEAVKAGKANKSDIDPAPQLSFARTLFTLPKATSGVEVRAVVGGAGKITIKDVRVERIS